MLRLKAFRPTSDKIVKIQLHPTHPWMVTADDSDRVSVWNWEHRQVQNSCSIYRFGSAFPLAVCCVLMETSFRWCMSWKLVEWTSGVWSAPSWRSWPKEKQVQFSLKFYQWIYRVVQLFCYIDLCICFWWRFWN